MTRREGAVRLSLPLWFALAGCAGPQTGPEADPASGNGAGSQRGSAEVDRAGQAGSSHRPGESLARERAADPTSTSGPPPALLDAEICAPEAARCLEARAILSRANGELRRTSLAYGEGGDGARRAVALFDQVLDLLGPTDPVTFARCRALLAAGEAQAALPVLRDLGSRFPADAEVQGSLGVALLASGQVEAARRAFSRAAALDPRSADRQLSLGTTLFLLGRYPEAERAYRQALVVEPGRAQAHGDLGSLLVVSGRLEEGEAQLRRALALDPQRASYRSNLAYALLTGGDSATALREVQIALELDPRLVSAWLNQGLILLELGDREEARKAFERARDLDPSDPRPRQALSDLDSAPGLPPAELR